MNRTYSGRKASRLLARLASYEERFEGMEYDDYDPASGQDRASDVWIQELRRREERVVAVLREEGAVEQRTNGEESGGEHFARKTEGCKHR